MSDLGLRERNKQRLRERIARTAADLFARRGYEQVSMREIAAAAEVSEQTVYNHFAGKRELVLDRDAQLRDALTAAVADRVLGVSPASAIGEVAASLIDALAQMSVAEVRGGLGYLARRSPELRRLALEMTDRHADAIAAVLAAEPGGPPPPLAKLHGTALAWVIQTITDESGEGAAAGRSPAEIAARLRPTVDVLVAELDAWWAGRR